jgi:hypothetical protein
VYRRVAMMIDKPRSCVAGLTMLSARLGYLSRRRSEHTFSEESVMRKIGLTIAAAAAVLTSFVAPANAGCKSVTKIFESGSRTVTQKVKVCDNSGSEANDSQGGKGSGSQGSGSQSGKGSASQERFAEQQTGYHLDPTGPGPANLCPTGLCGAGPLDALRCGAGLEGSRRLAVGSA